ncbi:hypothetical protein HAX54_033945 [Datura stramonium]|uniref:Uncharacterized protein n=1 Tax=Datura stramonium TaxID=4076 RepID=A0ABS8VD64_DATST|nr:hypothetical protein [Datura stramonium]
MEPTSVTRLVRPSNPLCGIARLIDLEVVCLDPNPFVAMEYETLQKDASIDLGRLRALVCKPELDESERYGLRPSFTRHGMTYNRQAWVKYIDQCLQVLRSQVDTLQEVMG